MSEEQLIKAVAWRIHDFADGWFAVTDQHTANRYKSRGHAVEPLFLAPPEKAAPNSKLHDLTEEDVQRASIDWSIAEVDLGLSDTDWGCMEHVLKMFINHRRAGGNPNPSQKDPNHV